MLKFIKNKNKLTTLNRLGKDAKIKSNGSRKEMKQKQKVLT